MKKLTLEVEDSLANEIKSGKKAIAVVDKEQLENMKDTESQVVGPLEECKIAGGTAIYSAHATFTYPLEECKIVGGTAFKKSFTKKSDSLEECKIAGGKAWYTPEAVNLNL